VRDGKNATCKIVNVYAPLRKVANARLPSTPAASTSLRPTTGRKKAAARSALARRRAVRLGESGYGSASQEGEGGLQHVLILRSVGDENCFNTGCTEDLQSRLDRHNNGEVSHAAKHKPWAIKTAIAFIESDPAFAFERYLKTASGRTLARKAPLTGGPCDPESRPPISLFQIPA